MAFQGCSATDDDRLTRRVLSLLRARKVCPFMEHAAATNGLRINATGRWRETVTPELPIAVFYRGTRGSRDMHM